MPYSLAVNGRFTQRRVSGVERYANELLGCLPTEGRLIRPKKTLNGPAGHLWEQFSLPHLLKKNELLWSPANSGPISVSRQVVTIHDTLVIDHPEWFRLSFAIWYRLLLPTLVRRVAKLITVSEYSRSRLINVFRLPPDKVISIPNGVSRERFHPSALAEIESVRAKYSLPLYYLLFVGSIEPRKNLKRLVQAWEMIQPGYPQFCLVIAGGFSPLTHKPEFISSIPSVMVIGYVDDRELPALYSGATAFLYPSLYEGFGLQVLEAMACGVPVLAANTGALPEVIGKSGLLTNPLSTSDMASSMAKLIDDSRLRDDLMDSGLDRVKSFSWEMAAERVGLVLQEIMAD